MYMNEDRITGKNGENLKEKLDVWSHIYMYVYICPI